MGRFRIYYYVTFNQFMVVRLPAIFFGVKFKTAEYKHRLQKNN